MLNTGGSGDLAGHSCDSWQLVPRRHSQLHMLSPHSFLSPHRNLGWPGESMIEEEPDKTHETVGTVWGVGRLWGTVRVSME